MPTITVGELRRRAILQSGIGVSGQANPAGTDLDRIRLPDRPEPADYWTGGFVLLHTSPESVHRVIGWEAQTAYLLPPLDSLIPSSTPYLLWRHLPWESLEEALSSGLRQVWNLWAKPVTKTITIQANTFSYPIVPEIAPHGVYRIEVQPLSAYGIGYPYERIPWRYHGDGGKVELPPHVIQAYAGRQLRIWGAPMPPPWQSASSIEVEMDGDDELLVRFLAGRILEHVGLLMSLHQPQQAQLAGTQMQAGLHMQREAIEPMRWRRRHLWEVPTSW